MHPFAGSIVGSYKGGLWVAAAVTVFGVFANLLLLKLERNYEYDEVQRRERCEPFETALCCLRLIGSVFVCQGNRGTV